MTDQQLKLQFYKINLGEVLKELKIYYKKAKFACFSGNIFTYNYKTHSKLHEFCFITDDEVLLDKLTVKELNELKNIRYFSFTTYDLNLKEDPIRSDYVEDDIEF